jgi:hypothetical protein
MASRNPSLISEDLMAIRSPPGLAAWRRCPWCERRGRRTGSKHQPGPREWRNAPARASLPLRARRSRGRGS